MGGDKNKLFYSSITVPGTRWAPHGRGYTSCSWSLQGANVDSEQYQFLDLTVFCWNGESLIFLKPTTFKLDPFDTSILLTWEMCKNCPSKVPTVS